MRNRLHVLDVYVELDKKIPIGEFIRNLRDRDMELSNLQMERDSYMGNDVICFTVTLAGKKALSREVLLRTVTKLEGVRFAEEI